MMKRDYSVSLTRVIATLFIVICHIGSYFNSALVGQFFNVGVPIFFMISGYLYGDRKIERAGDFLFRRYIRLEIPALIWLSIICISAFLRKAELPALHEGVFLLLNLEGLNFVFTKMEDLFIGPWFFTNIMICYALFVLFLRIEGKHPEIDQLLTQWGGVIPLLIFGALSLIHISTSGVLGFFIGAELKRRHLLDQIKRSQIVIYVFVFLCAITVRLLTKQLIDGTLYYDEMIVPLTHIALATAIFASIKWLFSQLPSKMEKLASSKPMQHLDSISIYIYISHDMLFSGVVLSVFKWPLPVYVIVPIFFCLVVIFATVLWSIGEYLTHKIERVKGWLIG